MAKQTFTTGQVLTAAQMTSLQETAMGGGPASTKTVSYVLVAADAGTRIAMNAAGATTITVNTGLFSAGDIVTIQNIGAGVCTITAGTATVSTSSSLALKQYDSGTLYFTSTGVSIFFASDAADSPLTTKGDLYGFSTVDARIPIGTNGHVLTADSAQSLGLKWAAPASGKILQVVTNSYSTLFTTSSTSYVDTGLSTTITPTAATSKILVMYNGIHALAGGAASATNLRILRTATNILTYNANGYTNTNNLFAHTIACHVVDSPNTTSATTYKIQISNDVVSNISAQRNNEASILTLLEIGA